MAWLAAGAAFLILWASLFRIHHKLDRIVTATRRIIHKEVEMSQELDALTVQVTETVEVEQSAIALLNGLSEQIRALQNDPAAIAALADQLAAQSGALAAAIVANTPANP